MESRYLTVIVRMRLDASDSRRSAERIVGGSIQRIGAEDVYYFSSFDELPELLRRTAEGTAPPEHASSETPAS